MDRHWKELVEKLPKQPCGDLQNDILSDIYDNDALGENLMLYHRESVELSDPIEQLMGAEDWDRWQKSKRRHWGARCTCSHCGEDFIAGYIQNGHGSGIILTAGEDGETYDGYAESGPDANEYMDGETVICPNCWQSCIVTRRKELRRGRTYQVMQAETVNVEEYTVIMYWLVARHQDENGTDQVQFLPNAALLIDTDGKLRRFRAVRRGNEVTDVTWTPCSKSRDPMQIPYYCYGATMNRQVGGWVCTYGPELKGHTGEKTAIEKYIGVGGTWPGAYLHVWRKHPQVENLMRQGFAKAVRGEIDQSLDVVYRADLCDAPRIGWVNWNEVKPHRMLNMSKVAFQTIRAKHWTSSDAKCWDRYRTLISGADAVEFEHCREKIGSGGIDKLLGMYTAGWNELTPARVTKYLEKQGLLDNGVQMLIDYRRMLNKEGLGETEETIWPRNLTEAHDRVVQMVADRMQLKNDHSFVAVYAALQRLEWTDGELCIVIPKAEQELIDEGRTLRHCVGTYGRTHCSGKPVFFVRHYRRPERSYYTLNIDLTGGLPKEIQLHGYGNERHGESKQYQHGIPKKVRDFCDRWEREVLTPWFADRKKKSIMENKANKKGAKSA